MEAAPLAAAVAHRRVPAATAVDRSCAVSSRPVAMVPDDLWREWWNLARVAAEPNCFAEPWFLDAGLRHLRGQQSVRLVEVRQGGELIGLIPLTIGDRYARLPVRHCVDWTHYHAFLSAPLIRAGAEQAFWTALLVHLDTAAWAPGFLHLSGLVSGGAAQLGLSAAAAALGRAAPVVHRHQRAALSSHLSPSAYFEAAVRKKKRKELKRLENRLADLGQVTLCRWSTTASVDAWCDQFLALERSGWKGQAGSALACRGETEAFFREAISGAAAAGRLEMLRLDLDERPLALLINFRTPPGAFSFKIAFDEAFARFSPGVMLEIRNLAILDDPEIEWTDSCAAEGHPMIDSLWTERREIVRMTVRLAGWKRGMIYHSCRALELGSALWRRVAA